MRAAWSMILAAKRFDRVANRFSGMDEMSFFS
jgi:hypothetical protein